MPSVNGRAGTDEEEHRRPNNTGIQTFLRLWGLQPQSCRPGPWYQRGSLRGSLIVLLVRALPAASGRAGTEDEERRRPTSTDIHILLTTHGPAASELPARTVGRERLFERTLDSTSFGPVLTGADLGRLQCQNGVTNVVTSLSPIWGFTSGMEIVHSGLGVRQLLDSPLTRP